MYSMPVCIVIHLLLTLVFTLRMKILSLLSHCIMVLIFPLDWFGVLFIRQGIYQEGVFKFDLNIPENYPDGDCPVGVKLFPEKCVDITTRGHTPSLTSVTLVQVNYLTMNYSVHSTYLSNFK